MLPVSNKFGVFPGSALPLAGRRERTAPELLNPTFM
jgi:hypothetical protein